METLNDMADVVGGRYRLDQFLGGGAMSEVWQATDLELDRLSRSSSWQSAQTQLDSTEKHVQSRRSRIRT